MCQRKSRNFSYGTFQKCAKSFATILLTHFEPVWKICVYTGKIPEIFYSTLISKIAKKFVASKSFAFFAEMKHFVTTEKFVAATKPRPYSPDPN